MNNKPLAKSKDIVMQEIKDECLLYNLENNKALSLNPTAYFIWRNCDGQTDAREIADKVKREFNLAIEEDYVLLALDELSRADLISSGEIKSDKISRRKALIKYGMLAAALPIVTGIVAPKAAHAASVCAEGSCSVASDCPPSTDPICDYNGGPCNCIAICTDNCCSYAANC